MPSNELKDSQEAFKDATNNMLDGVYIILPWDENEVPVYESNKPDISVPGALEFAGLHEAFKSLLKKQLKLYFYRGTPGNTPLIDDRFPELNPSQKVALIKKCDPPLLGLAATVLSDYHEGLRSPESDRKYYWGDNGLRTADNWAHNDRYANYPFSNELRREISTYTSDTFKQISIANDWCDHAEHDKYWHQYSFDAKVRLIRETNRRISDTGMKMIAETWDTERVAKLEREVRLIKSAIELKILDELAMRLREGFNLGDSSNPKYRTRKSS